MKKNIITIKINKTPKEIQDYYINPNNTPLWLDSIVQEKTNEWPIKIGTVYRNQNKKGVWTEYVVTNIKANKIFELTSKDGNYHVKYTHKPIDNNSSELEYCEWVGKGELDEPFTLHVLQKLKLVLESQSPEL